MAERGWALVDARKTADADAVFDELLKTFPQSPHAVDARFNLAESASEAHDYAEVIRLLSPLPHRLTPIPGRQCSGRQGRLDLNRPAHAAGPVSSGADPDRAGRLAGCRDDAGPADRGVSRQLRNREARFLRAEAALRLDHAADAQPFFAALAAEPPKPTDPEGFSCWFGSGMFKVCWV